jgi:putative glutamine amidotransferase
MSHAVKNGFAPKVLVSPEVATAGDEFHDLSTSLSGCYQRALIDAGAVPFILPITLARHVIAECVRLSDGVLLTGGVDVQPALYRSGSCSTASTSGSYRGERDYAELVLVDEVFRQRKPLLAICRGHQILNVALGGTLINDIPSDVPEALDHNQVELSREPVHEVQLTPDSLIAKITRCCILRVNSTHHQAVGQVARCLRAVAQTSDGIVEALELYGDAPQALPFLLGVQFHPERLADRHKEHAAVFRAFVQTCAIGRPDL